MIPPLQTGPKAAENSRTLREASPAEHDAGPTTADTLTAILAYTLAVFTAGTLFGFDLAATVLR